MEPDAPTPEAVGALLQAAGFAKAQVCTSGADCGVVYAEGFDVLVDRCCGGVLVRWWHLASATRTQAQVLAHLTWYADAIRAIGWTVETHYRDLTVTAPDGESHGKGRVSVGGIDVGGSAVSATTPPAARAGRTAESSPAG